MKTKTLYYITKFLILIAAGSIIASWILIWTKSLWIVFFSCLFAGMFLDLFIFQAIEKEKGWQIWK